MKNSILTIAFFVTTLTSSLQLTAQEFKSLDKSPMDMDLSSIFLKLFYHFKNPSTFGWFI